MIRRWSILPLRIRLVTLGVVGLLIGFAGGGTALVVLLDYSLQRSVDDAATKTAKDIAGLLVDKKLPERITTGRETTIVQIYDADGKYVRGSLGADPLVPLLKKHQLDDALDGGHFTVSAARAQGTAPLRATAEQAGDQIVIVGVSQSELGAVPKLALGLTITLSVLALAVAMALWWMVGWTLRPVEAARSKQRAFVADAAHELRSPLANMRTELEVAQRIGAPDDLVTDLLTDVERLSRMTEDLLLLARLDDARRPWRPEDLDIVKLLVVLAETYEDARVPVTTETDRSGLNLHADHDALHRIFTNLIDNAVRHAETAVTVTCATDDSEVVVTVADDGPGIPLADRERVFDRFTRLDDARGRDSGGTGLGLPIVAELIATHRGTIRLHGVVPHGLCAEVRLPRELDKRLDLDRRIALGELFIQCGYLKVGGLRDATHDEGLGSLIEPRLGPSWWTCRDQTAENQTPTSSSVTRHRTFQRPQPRRCRPYPRCRCLPWEGPRRRQGEVKPTCERVQPCESPLHAKEHVRTVL